MSSKDSKSVQDKLKQFFKNLNKNHGGNIRRSSDFALTEELQRELSKESPVATRLKTLKCLGDIVLTNRLEEKAPEKLWALIQDLLSSDQATEVRHTTFTFFKCLIKGQNDRLGLLRAHFFRVIKQYEHPEDVNHRFELLQTLTDNGKDILYFEEEVGPFLLNWLPDIASAGITLEYLGTLLNIIKYNAAYLDEEVTSGLVQYICVLCCSTNEQQVVMACLNILDAIVAYTNLPPDSLPQFIGALCRTVNGIPYSQMSWKIMRNLLGTHMGHSALFTMCRILQEPALRDDSSLLRGAVFYIKMALWDTQPLPSLKCPPSSVLPSILQAVQCNQPAVTYEVALSIQLLVSKHGLELQNSSWSIVLDILSIIVKQIELAPTQPPNPLVATLLHETLNAIENLIKVGSFNGSVDRFFDIIEECANSRPETSVLHLVQHLSKNIIPTKCLWLTNLFNLLQKYFKKDVQTNIRLKVLDILSKVVTLYRWGYEEELIDRIVIPHTSGIARDNDIVIRSAVAKLLIELCMNCDSKRCLEMLDILEKLLNRPFEHPEATQQPLSEADVSDIKVVVAGLIELFTVKIHRLPSLHAIRIYKMLVNHMDLHYNCPKLFENCNQPRFLIFNSFLKMRADSQYHLGYPDASGKLKYSSYLCVTYRNTENLPMGSPPPTSPAISTISPCTVTNMSLGHSFKVVINCLKFEKDWDVLQLVLQELPHVVQNKSLILGKHRNSEIDLLVDALCGMITDKSLCLPESLNAKMVKADFHSLVLLAVASLASYHAYIDSTHQVKMIWCLIKYGFGPRCSRQCITALTICTLEMKDVMVKMLPEALLILSKISATIHIAIAVLEFLSTLTQLPMVFANFVADQYMAVFAISLPYTNPFKYNHYTVSLAHHVIAVWFLKCRLPFRKDFVKFITNGLQTNVLTPFEETNILKSDLSKLNQDSSDRKRSSSLTEQSSRRREHISIVGRVEGKPVFDFHRPEIDRTLFTFYVELTETCIDLMARYTFSPCSTLPKRMPTAEFLLSGGQSMTWLIGNRLITVTTSGCSQRPLKQGLCDKCFTMCKLDNLKTPENELKLSRSTRTGSNEKEKEESGSTRASRQNSDEKSNNNTSASSPVEENKRLSDKLEQLPSKLQQIDSKMEKLGCACWCQDWAEIYVRRPTGDMSWVMRIQNQTSSQQTMYEFPLNEISTLFLPSLSQTNYELDTYDEQRMSYPAEDAVSNTAEEEYGWTSMPISIPGSPTKNSPSRQNSRDSIEDDLEYDDDGSKSRNPVRRSNSSPEMSANWKNPFLLQKQQERDRDDGRSGADDDSSKKVKNYSKDMRVSCEAIPEEIAGMGTTPPSNDPIHTRTTPSTTTITLKTNLPLHESHPHHPTLLSCHSYPGSSGPPEPTIPAKPYMTVPPSPNVLQNTSPGSLGAMTSSRNPTLGVLRTSKSESIESTTSEKGVFTGLSPLSGKPPQSPTQTSPRLPRHASFKEKDGYDTQKPMWPSQDRPPTTTSRDKLKDKKNNSNEKLNQTELTAQVQKRDRSSTISVMSPVRKPRSDQLRQFASRIKEPPKSGINPSFIFLQLYQAAYFGSPTERPLLVDSSQVVQRALKVLDCIPPFETHKIGVIYIGPGQCNNETEILKNCYGSTRYVEFLQSLGTLIKLQDADPQVLFLGGLEQNGADGKFAYIWEDDVIRVTFHVATLMPNKETDPNCNNKKLHIGNNYVTIVYNESGEEYNINTIKGQFNFACIIIQPLDHNTNKVTVKAKDELTKLIGNTEAKIVSDQNVAILARQLALHANLASLVWNSLKVSTQDPYASNWLERLRKIKNVRNKIMQESKKEQSNNTTDEQVSLRTRRQMEDFTEYT